MADEITLDRAVALEKIVVAYLEKGAETDFKPYVTLITESLSRCMKLVTESNKAEKEMSSEILRAVVVLNHAYLEDFMRTLALAFLPTADEKALDGVPLAGGTSGPSRDVFIGEASATQG